MSRSQKYSFARSSKKSGGSFHWLLALALLGVVIWIFWENTRTSSPPKEREAKKNSRPSTLPPSAPTSPSAKTKEARAPKPTTPSQPLPPVPAVGMPLPDGGRVPPPSVVVSTNLYALVRRSDLPPVPAPASILAPPPLPPEPPAIRFVMPPAPSNPPPPADTVPASVSLPRTVVDAQIALARRGISPGSIDGRLGTQTRAAIRGFQRFAHLPETGELDEPTREQLALDAPANTRYALKSEDLSRLQPLGKTWLAKSQQNRLDYENALELVAEKFYAHPLLIKQLNPSIDWTHVAPGTELVVPNIAAPSGREKAAFIRILLSQRQLEVYGARSNLVAQFPCSIAQRVEKRPVGELHVAKVAPNPTYTFNPEIFPESEEAQQLNRKLILQPGPNNPVGTVWIGLDRPGYGIHGTPRPEDVGRTESHGCFRLSNWNAEHLLKLVKVGTPVFVEP